MSNYNRVNKSNGSTAWKAGETITHTEHNDEWDTFLNEYNGNIDNRNIAQTAGQLIGSEKVESHATTETQYLTSTSAGDTFSGTRPTDLDGELEAIRYRLLQLSGGSNFKGTNTSGTMTDLSWLEPAVVGPNLLPNSGFEALTGAAGTAPDGWTKVGSPSTFALQSATELDEGVNKRSLNVIATSTGNEGVSYVLDGLKADTLYVVGAAYVRTTGGVLISVSGAVSSGAYRAFSESDTTSTTGTLITRNYVVKTDSSGTALTCTFGVTGQAGSEVDLYRVWVKEMGDRTTYENIPPIPAQVKTETANTFVDNTGGTVSGGYLESTISNLSASVYVPGPGYELTYEAMINISMFNWDLVSQAAARVTIEMDTGSGYNTVRTYANEVGHAGVYAGAFTWTESPHLKYVLPLPVPGTTYAFRIKLGAYDGTHVYLNALNVTTSESHAVLTMRRV